MMSIKRNELETFKDFLSWAEQSFLNAELYFGHGTDNAWDEAVWLGCYVLNLPHDIDRSVLTRKLTQAEKETLVNLVTERVTTRKPLAYLLKEAWFNYSPYYVDERVIVPRSPFAELIQNRFQPWLGNLEPKRILDLCTGSGCIAIECAKAFPAAKVDAIDISKDALVVAKINAHKHRVEEQVTFYLSNLFEQLPKGEAYDLIVSNPPYVPDSSYQKLQTEFLAEPKIALVSEAKGLDITNKILKQASSFLNKNGHLFVEVGEIWQALEDAHPKLPLTWIEFEFGGEGVFYLNQKDLIYEH